MSIKLLTSSCRQTKQIGEDLAKNISNNCLGDKKAFLVGLEGDLGGGKTTFIQGFARGLGIKEKIISPTFVILKKFKIHPVIRPGAPSDDGATSSVRNAVATAGRQFNNFYHIDCYRLGNPKEILALDFKKIMADPQSIICIEWANKIKKYLPKGIFWLKFNFKTKEKREIIFSNGISKKIWKKF